MNKVIAVCNIKSDFEYSHSVGDTDFYIAYAETERQSGTKDIFKIMVSNKLINISDYTGKCVALEGQFRSYNMPDGDRKKLLLFLFVTSFEFTDTNTYSEVYLDGFVCKPPIYRITPLGREISDVIVAVNRTNGKSDYIPCILWGKNARIKLRVGDAVSVTGRIQSREYVKDGETKTAYELSVNNII